MSQTIHDAIKHALIEESIQKADFNNCFNESMDAFTMTPEKYRRMWKKITGRDVSIEAAKQALKGGK